MCLQIALKKRWWHPVFYAIADGTVQRMVRKFDKYSPRNLASVANAQKDEKVS